MKQTRNTKRGKHDLHMASITYLETLHADLIPYLQQSFNLTTQSTNTKEGTLDFDLSRALNEGIIIVLFRNRHHLHSAYNRRRLGFIYKPFVVGAEFWELHEVFRKMMLTSILIFIPPTTRTAVAILICVLTVASLNYVQPHKNPVVFWVAETSFILTAFKYLTSIFIVTQKVKGEYEDSKTSLGWVLVGLDVCMMMGSVVAVAAVAVLLKKSEMLTAYEEYLKVAISIFPQYLTQERYSIDEKNFLVKVCKKNISLRLAEMVHNIKIKILDDVNPMSHVKKIGSGLIATNVANDLAGISCQFASSANQSSSILSATVLQCIAADLLAVGPTTKDIYQHFHKILVD